MIDETELYKSVAESFVITREGVITYIGDPIDSALQAALVGENLLTTPSKVLGPRTQNAKEAFFTKNNALRNQIIEAERSLALAKEQQAELHKQVWPALRDAARQDLDELLLTLPMNEAPKARLVEEAS